MLDEPTDFKEVAGHLIDQPAEVRPVIASCSLGKRFMERVNDGKRGLAGTFLAIYGGSLLLTGIAHDDGRRGGHPLHPVGTSYESAPTTTSTSGTMIFYIAAPAASGAAPGYNSPIAFTIMRPMAEEPMEARGERLAIIANLVERPDFRRPPESPNQEPI